MDWELRRDARMAMRGVPERLGLRFADGHIELRSKPSGHGTTNFEWNGYATVYGADFEMWDQNGERFTESVGQGAAKRSLANPNLDVPFLIGHNNAGVPLARTKSGTMTLRDDSVGVLTHVPEMDGRREEVRALASAVERGDLDEMSLAFICLRQQWDSQYEHRTVLEMDLHRGDVCAVTHGANPATAGAWMAPVEQLSFRRPASIGAPRLIEVRTPTAPYTAHAGEGNQCPACHSVNDDAAQFCDQCGHSVQPKSPVSNMAAVEDMTQKCSSCGQPNSSDAKFCGQCGHGLSGDMGSQDYWSSGRPAELRASAASDINSANAPDYDPAATDHPQAVACQTCDGNGSLPHPVTGGDGPPCPSCNGTGAVIEVDGQSGIPGPEVQLSAARRLELRMRELELDELARPAARTA